MQLWKWINFGTNVIRRLVRSLAVETGIGFLNAFFLCIGDEWRCLRHFGCLGIYKSFMSTLIDTFELGLSCCWIFWLFLFSLLIILTESNYYEYSIVPSSFSLKNALYTSITFHHHSNLLQPFDPIWSDDNKNVNEV